MFGSIEINQTFIALAKFIKKEKDNET